MAVEVKEFTSPDLDGYVEGYCFRCTTTWYVFGPTLSADDGADKAEEFLQFVLKEHNVDPRCVAPRALADMYRDWQETE